MRVTSARRLLVAAMGLVLIAASAATAFTAPARADPGTGVVTFRLTLRGDVDPKDLFGVFVEPSASSRIPLTFNWWEEQVCEPPWVSEGSPYGPRPPCAAGDYEVRLDDYHVPLGAEIEYSFFWRDATVRDPLPDPQWLYTGTVTVGPTPQVRYFVYDYSLGLPNTAVAEPDGGRGLGPVAVIAWLAALVLLGVRFRRIRRT